jgi:transcription factor WhiB
MLTSVDPSRTTTPACASRTEIFTDEMLESPPGASAPAEDRRRHGELVSAAQEVCFSCPVLAGCLYRAVVDHDVAGYVAGTTERQRAEIRRRLGVVVQPEDFDTLAGVAGGHRQIDHDEVLRLRRAHPDESLERLAHRLGCSLSTVKRHLRRERTTPSRPSAGPVRPTLRMVLDATASVTAGARRSRSVAA